VQSEVGFTTKFLIVIKSPSLATMKVIAILLCFAVSVFASPTPTFPVDDMARQIIEEISNVATKDPTLLCSYECLSDTVFDWASAYPPSSNPKVETNATNKMVETFERQCNVYKKGDTCLNNCPDGDLKTLLEKMSEMLNYMCKEQFEEIMKNLVEAWAIFEKGVPTCARQCSSITARTIGAMFGRFPPLFPPITEAEAIKICELSECSVQCSADQFKEAKHPEWGIIYSEIMKAHMRGVTSFYLRRGGWTVDMVPKQCQWYL